MGNKTDRTTTTGEQHDRYELKALIETCRLLIESRDTDFILNNLLLIVMGKMMVNKTAVIRPETNSKGYYTARAKGRTRLKSEDTATFDFDLADADEQGFFVVDALNLADEHPLSEFSMLFNLRVRNRHLGFLAIGEKMGNKKWLQREIDFVESLSTISAAAIDNSEMVGKLKSVNRNLDQRLNELHTLFELSKDFNALIDREQIISIFKFTMMGQLLIKHFFLVFNYSGELRVISNTPVKRDPADSELKHLFNFEQEVVDVDESHKRENAFLRDNDISKLLTLRLQNETRAIIGIGKKANGEPFSHSDINFLLSLGNLAMLSVQKTYLLEERIEKERMEEELNIAKTIQQGLLPHPVPRLKGLELEAAHIPSRQVGGDYFDIEKTPQNNYLIAIADVTGKGVPAALLMSNLQAMLKALVPLDISLAEATGQLNDNIYKNTPSDKFITFFWGSIDPESQVFTYVNAGHNPPLILRNQEEDFRLLEDGGLLLGAWPTTTPYHQGTFQLQSGDLFIAYTDGVTEAMDAKEQEFGEDRLKEVVLKKRNDSVQEILNAIIREVDQYADGRQFDDLTLIVYRVE